MNFAEVLKIPLTWSYPLSSYLVSQGVAICGVWYLKLYLKAYRSFSSTY